MQNRVINHASLFTGIGGFDLAAQWMGWNNIFQVEIDDFCTKVLNKNFPNVTKYKDIRDFNGEIYKGSVDVISGGFPCQPFSVAGKQKGRNDERHLWPEMLRVIREVQPIAVVGENVPGIIGMELNNVLADLEGEGFRTQTFAIPACGKNAPHRRERIWVIAYNANTRVENMRQSQNKIHTTEYVTDTNDTSTSGKIQTGRSEFNELFDNEKTITDAVCEGPQRSHKLGVQFTGCNKSTWDGFPTQSPVCGRNDGVSNRLDRLKALGNAIVPQVAYELFIAVEKLIIYGDVNYAK